MTRAELRAEQADGIARLRDHPDEFHPDPRVAAAFADLKSNDSVQQWLTTQIVRLEAAIAKSPTSMDHVHLGESRLLLKRAKAERTELEEVAAQWTPSTD